MEICQLGIIAKLHTYIVYIYVAKKYCSNQNVHNLQSETKRFCIYPWHQLAYSDVEGKSNINLHGGENFQPNCRARREEAMQCECPKTFRRLWGGDKRIVCMLSCVFRSGRRRPLYMTQDFHQMVKCYHPQLENTSMKNLISDATCNNRQVVHIGSVSWIPRHSMIEGLLVMSSCLPSTTRRWNQLSFTFLTPV